VGAVGPRSVTVSWAQKAFKSDVADAVSHGSVVQRTDAAEEAAEIACAKSSHAHVQVPQPTPPRTDGPH
jgi:hypothetical protein